MKPALIIGSTCVDVIINIHHLPKTEEDIHPTSQSMAIGGCAFNAAYMVRLLNAPHTFITPVGGGTYGDYVAKLMTQAGIPIAVRVPVFPYRFISRKKKTAAATAWWRPAGSGPSCPITE